MSNNILILAALENELPKAHLPTHVRFMHTGVGKVNAAITAMHAVLEAKPSLVINYGTVGKINPAVHGLLQVEKVLQRDMMTLPLAPRGVTPFSDAPDVLLSGQRGVVCGTGDSFVTAADPWLAENQVDVVDMELFAIARVCERFSIPWRSFKYVTDAADESSGNDWSENVHRGADLFLELLRQDIFR